LSNAKLFHFSFFFFWFCEFRVHSISEIRNLFERNQHFHNREIFMIVSKTVSKTCFTCWNLEVSNIIVIYYFISETQYRYTIIVLKLIVMIAFKSDYSIIKYSKLLAERKALTSIVVTPHISINPCYNMFQHKFTA